MQKTSLLLGSGGPAPQRSSTYKLQTIFDFFTDFSGLAQF